jgi:hypothetical protein
MTTLALIEDITTEATPKLSIEYNNTPTQETNEIHFPREESLISLHASSSILTPQILKLTGYNKH